jgi:hypothetical protein
MYTAYDPDYAGFFYDYNTGLVIPTTILTNIYFMISRNNGMSWSKPIYVNNVTNGYRGFQSMTLDTQTGHLLFGWYDSRDDPTNATFQYFVGVIPKEKLDRLVNAIPLSDPLFDTPSVSEFPLP